jgi:hypothetical protein
MHANAHRTPPQFLCASPRNEVARSGPRLTLRISTSTTSSDEGHGDRTTTVTVPSGNSKNSASNFGACSLVMPDDQQETGRDGSYRPYSASSGGAET